MQCGHLQPVRGSVAPLETACDVLAYLNLGLLAETRVFRVTSYDFTILHFTFDLFLNTIFSFLIILKLRYQQNLIRLIE